MVTLQGHSMPAACSTRTLLLSRSTTRMRADDHHAAREVLDPLLREVVRQSHRRSLEAVGHSRPQCWRSSSWVVAEEEDEVLGRMVPHHSRETACTPSPLVTSSPSSSSKSVTHRRMKAGDVALTIFMKIKEDFMK